VLLTSPFFRNNGLFVTTQCANGTTAVSGYCSTASSGTNGGSSGIDTGTIAAIVVGVVLGSALLLLLLVFLCLRVTKSGTSPAKANPNGEVNHDATGAGAYKQEHSQFAEPSANDVSREVEMAQVNTEDDTTESM